MAVVETSGIIKSRDSSGNIVFFYPMTLKDNVSGMEDVDAHLTDTGNPHNITAEQIGALSSAPVDMTSTDGMVYECTVPGINSLIVCASFIGVPKKESVSNVVRLNVNGLGVKLLRRRSSVGSATTASGYDDDWLSANKPIRVMYDGYFWVTDIAQPHASDLMGSVPVTKGGTGAKTAVEACTNLGALPTAGGTMSGALDMGSNRIANLATPTNDSDADTKKYADEHSCILTSSTPGSTKKFKIVVDDSGTITATEITD